VGKGMRNNVGKGHAAAGADCNLRRPGARGETEGNGRGVVWRMSPYERGREPTPPEVARDAALGSGNAGSRQRGSGRLAALAAGRDRTQGRVARFRYAGASLGENRERAGCMRVSA